MIGLILAAGKGERLSNSLTEKTVKPLVQINHEYLINYSLRNCFKAGIKTVIIIVSPDNKEEVFSAVGDEFCGMKIMYAVQHQPKGLINAVISAFEYLNDSVMLQLSDEIFVNSEITDCIDVYNNCADFIVTYVLETDEKKIRNNFSIESDANGTVIHCIEKPRIAINTLKGTGLCVFSAECIELLKKEYDSEKNTPDNLCDFFNLLVENHKTGKTFCIAEEEININTVNELNYAQKKIRED